MQTCQCKNFSKEQHFNKMCKAKLRAKPSKSWKLLIFSMSFMSVESEKVQASIQTWNNSSSWVLITPTYWFSKVLRKLLSRCQRMKNLCLQSERILKEERRDKDWLKRRRKNWEESMLVKHLISTDRWCSNKRKTTMRMICPMEWKQAN